jgi:hypothetical protein
MFLYFRTPTQFAATLVQKNLRSKPQTHTGMPCSRGFLNGWHHRNARHCNAVNVEKSSTGYCVITACYGTTSNAKDCLKNQKQYGSVMCVQQKQTLVKSRLWDFNGQDTRCRIKKSLLKTQKKQRTIFVQLLLIWHYLRMPLPAVSWMSTQQLAIHLDCCVLAYSLRSSKWLAVQWRLATCNG